MKLLVDADYVVYKSCAAAETEIDWGDDVILVTSKFSDAYAAVKRELLKIINNFLWDCLLYTSPSPRDQRGSRMPSSA